MQGMKDKHNTWRSLLLASLQSHEPTSLQFVGTVVTIQPLTIEDSDSVQLHIDRSNIESTMQDFSFLIIGQLVQLSGEVTKKYSHDELIVEATYRVNQMKYGKDFQKIAIDIYVQFELTWILNSQLKSINEGMANLKRKRQLSQTMMENEEWPVTEMVSKEDIKKIFLAAELARLEQKSVQSDNLASQDIRILQKVQAISTRQQLVKFIQNSNLYSRLQSRQPKPYDDLKVIRRFLLPNSQQEQLEMSPSLLRLHMRYPGQTEKKHFDRVTIRTLMNIYQ